MFFYLINIEHIQSVINSHNSMHLALGFDTLFMCCNS